MSAGQDHKPVNILVVGQTPPPHHGQALMIERMLRGTYRGVRLVHVRMDFSSNMDEIERFRPHKLLRLIRLIFCIIYRRFRDGTPVLYFPPASANRVPMLRDLAILGTTRWLFRFTIFHFHAGGISTMYGKLPALLRPLFRHAYYRSDLAIRISRHTPEDGRSLQARAETLVPNGIEDECGTLLPRAGRGPEVQLLYVGALVEEKGLLVLVEACRILLNGGVPFRLKLVGGFIDPAFRERLTESIGAAHLQDHVQLAGILTGEAKHAAFRDADIFVFPSFFRPAETFGLVVVEAMSFALPVVATNWSGIPDVVADEETGLLVPPRDAEALARAVTRVARDPVLRQRLGEAGRRRFLARFTVEAYQKKMETVFLMVAENLNPSSNPVSLTCEKS